MRRLCKAVLAFSIVPGVLVLDDDLGFVTAAQAVIGRPFTPLSVAGVARRTTRRAYRGAYYYGGAAAVAGTAAGAYYYGGGYPYVPVSVRVRRIRLPGSLLSCKAARVGPAGR